MNLIRQLDRIPPFLCLAAARQIDGISMAAVSRDSGVALRTLSRLASSVTWANSRLDVIEAVSAACNVDLLDPETTMQNLKACNVRGWFDRLPPAQHRSVIRCFHRIKEGSE
jgi:hypothetical protein